MAAGPLKEQYAAAKEAKNDELIKEAADANPPFINKGHVSTLVGFWSFGNVDNNEAANKDIFVETTAKAEKEAQDNKKDILIETIAKAEKEAQDNKKDESIETFWNRGMAAKAVKEAQDNKKVAMVLYERISSIAKEKIKKEENDKLIKTFWNKRMAAEAEKIAEDGKKDFEKFQKELYDEMLKYEDMLRGAVDTGLIFLMATGIGITLGPAKDYYKDDKRLRILLTTYLCTGFCFLMASRFLHKGFIFMIIFLHGLWAMALFMSTLVFNKSRGIHLHLLYITYLVVVLPAFSGMFYWKRTMALKGEECRRLKCVAQILNVRAISHSLDAATEELVTHYEMFNPLPKPPLIVLVATKSFLQLIQSNPKESEDITRKPVVGFATTGLRGGLTGLVNTGNSCYMNTALQCLIHTPEIAHYFQRDYYLEINQQNPDGMKGGFAIAFGELLRRLWEPERTAIVPRQFKARLAELAPQFSGRNQHDVEELLSCMLGGLHEDLNRVKNKNKPVIMLKDADGRPDEEVANEYWADYIACDDSIIIDVFQGQYKSSLICSICRNTISLKFDTFRNLALPIPSWPTQDLSLYTCLGHFLQAQALPPGNMRLCLQCKKESQGILKLDIWKLPQVLMVHLKRFTSENDKLETIVNFPIDDLDLTNYVVNKNNPRSHVYQLFAIANHIGDTISGHYTSYVKLINENKWYSFNDSRVSSITETDLETDAAYILFYRRIETERCPLNPRGKLM